MATDRDCTAARRAPGGNPPGRRDPVELFRARLIAEFGLGESDVAGLEDEVGAEIAAAVAFAESSPYPSLDAAFEHVYTNPIPIRR